jgi:hypothetical protein
MKRPIPQKVLHGDNLPYMETIETTELIHRWIHDHDLCVHRCVPKPKFGVASEGNCKGCGVEIDDTTLCEIQSRVGEDLLLTPMLNLMAWNRGEAGIPYTEDELGHI